MLVTLLVSKVVEILEGVYLKTQTKNRNKTLFEGKKDVLGEFVKDDEESSESEEETEVRSELEIRKFVNFNPFFEISAFFNCLTGEFGEEVKARLNDDIKRKIKGFKQIQVVEDEKANLRFRRIVKIIA